MRRFFRDGDNTVQVAKSDVLFSNRTFQCTKTFVDVLAEALNLADPMQVFVVKFLHKAAEVTSQTSNHFGACSCDRSQTFSHAIEFGR